MARDEGPWYRRTVDERTLSLTPIGVVRSPFRELAEAPRQSAAARGVEGRIELCAGRHLEDAIDDLARWKHLWIIFWFDRAGGYRPKVLPPRSDRRRGVLATRSPHRPNPLGLSVVRLERVEGLVLHVRDLDMLDGTPVLDIKPYVAYADAVDEAGDGWLADDPEPAWRVHYGDRAAEQLAFLRGHGVDLQPTIDARLSLGPRPHAYRRIRPRGDHAELALEDWRVDFHAQGRVIEVLRIRSGYRPKQLAASDPALAAHVALVGRFG
jgi:tRNA (adenine37-N6)-methyltransferase